MASNQNRFTESAVVPPPASPKSADQDVIFNSPPPTTQVKKTKIYEWKLETIIRKHKQKFEPTIAFINNTNKAKVKDSNKKKK